MHKLDLPDKLSPLLYMSKIKCLHECERKYYYQHHLHLGTSQRPKYFADGSNVHRCVELGLIHGRHVPEAILSKNFQLLKTFGVELTDKDLETFSSLSDADCDMFGLMIDAFFDRWESLGIKRVLSTEASVKFDLSGLSWKFTHWVVKADFVFEDEEGTWVGDLKTTSGYGPAVAKFYHSAPQTKTYFRILEEELLKQGIQVLGTKIFVLTKTKVPRCEIEEIRVTQQDKDQADLFIKEACDHLETKELMFSVGSHPEVFSRFMTGCINQFGHDCPYIPICINNIKSQAYLDDLISNWYVDADPDEHLELEKE